jgi:hypothetical protein
LERGQNGTGNHRGPNARARQIAKQVPAVVGDTCVPAAAVKVSCTGISSNHFVDELGERTRKAVRHIEACPRKRM